MLCRHSTQQIQEHNTTEKEKKEKTKRKYKANIFHDRSSSAQSTLQRWKFVDANGGGYDTNLEISGTTEKAMETHSIGVEIPATSITSVEASTTSMEASTNSTETSAEVVGTSYSSYGSFLLTRKLLQLTPKIPWKWWKLASCFVELAQASKEVLEAST